MITALAIFFIALCFVGIWTIEAKELNEGTWKDDFGFDLDETDGLLGEIEDEQKEKSE